MSFVLRMAVREIRASWQRLLFFFICIAVGVAAIVTIRSVIQSVRAGLTREARTLTGEGQIETERFDGFDSTAVLVGGVNWKAFGRGLFRASVSAGLTDSTPNFTVLVGYAYAF